MNKKTLERQQAIDRLRAILEPGDRVTCTVLHVSRSGMSRSIRLQCIAPDYTGKPSIRDISYTAALAMGARHDDTNGGVKMDGCGMDMCFAAVYGLGRALFPAGFGIEGVDSQGRHKRPKSEAQAARMVAAGCTFRGRNGDASGWDSDGGYALDYRS